jgi:hypothetical protein
MAKKQRDDQPTGAEEAEHERRGAAIAGRILRTLGLTAPPRCVDVRPLWDGRYRVNVLAGEDATSVRITHSFFVVADRDGAILASTPRITGSMERQPALGANGGAAT